MQDSDVEPLKVRRKQPFLGLLSIFLSIFLIIGGAFVMYRWISGPEILHMLRLMDWRWLLPAIFAYYLQYPMNAIRLYREIQWLTPPSATPPASFRLILKVTLSSGFISVTAPIGLMADAAKIGALRYLGNISTSQAIRCTLFDRIASAQWMALLALATLPLQWIWGVPMNSIGIQLLLSLGFLVAIVGLLFLPNMLRFINYGPLSKLANVLSGYALMFPVRRSVFLMAVSLANMVLVFITLYCLLRAISLTADLAVIACFLPFLQLVNGIPFLYLGWGGREIAMAATVGVASGLSLNQALVLSATWGVVLILAGAVNGLFVFGKWQRLRTVEAHSPSRNKL